MLVVVILVDRQGYLDCAIDIIECVVVDDDVPEPY